MYILRQAFKEEGDFCEGLLSDGYRVLSAEEKI
jgi:hypothetical protein